MERTSVAEIRAHVPAVEQTVYLNTGTAGPLPDCARAALLDGIEHEYRHGRASFANFERLIAQFGELRRAFARLLHADIDEIALTHHTSDGINIATWGLNWQPGDEVLVTTLEHEGGVLAPYLLAQRMGVDVRVVDLGFGDDPAAVLAALDRAITPRTRLLCISHVSWNSGTVLPLQPIVELAHQRGVLVLVDGAQAAGAIPLDLHALGVDVYAIPGQKWLCGPEGVGALYVRRDRISLLRPTFVSYFSLQDPTNWTLSGDFLLAAGARRYEVGTVFRPGIAAMLASLQWLEHDVGWEHAFGRIRELARYARERLAHVPHLSIITPPDQAGLIVFNVAALDPATTVNALLAQGIILRMIPLRGGHALRISTGFYNNEHDVDRLCAALTELQPVAA